MNSKFKLIPQIVIVILLIVGSGVTASTEQNTEASRILQAMQLYSDAAAIDYLSGEKTELLGQAESILLDVIEKNPASLDAHRKLMGVYLQMRNYRKAIQTLQSAISLSPEDPKLFIALAILYDHQGAYEYALPILDEALKLDPDQQLARDYKITIQQKMDMRNIAMDSNTPPHEMSAPHTSEKQITD